MQVLSPSSSCDPDRQYGKFKVVSVGFSLCQCSLPVYSAKLKAQLQLAYSLGQRINQETAVEKMNTVEICELHV